MFHLVFISPDVSTVFIAAQYHLMLPDLSRIIVKVDIYIPVSYV